MIHVCEPTIGEEELANVVDCIKTNWISSKGKYIEEFENKFSKYCGVKHGVTTTNGTTALHLAISSLGIGKGDEVIMPTFTMIATAFAVTYTGAKPVFVDSEPETWNVDVEKIEEMITNKTKAIMPVHIYGHPCDMDSISDIADDNDLYVVEDAAEAHGAEYKGRKVGGLSDIGCFSFYANKIITTGEGGMVVTNDEELVERARELRDLAHSKKKRFLHERVGYNYRMTNVQAAIGVAQMEKIEKFVNARRNNANRYNSLLIGINGITLPPEKPWAKNVYWMYSILIDKEKFGISRDELMMKLEDKGVGTRAFFVPMHKQPVYDKAKGQFPVSERLAENGLYLPSSSKLTEKEIRWVCDAISSLSR
ncbi:MAG: DegT/DnrJ/EryC1/StrS family aminotransferase [Candidatus Altiarchaeota archaeon]